MRSDSDQEYQIVYVGPGWTTLDQVAQRLEKGIRIVSGQMVRRIRPERRGPLSGLSRHHCARRIRGTVIAVGRQGDQQDIFQAAQFIKGA